MGRNSVRDTRPDWSTTEIGLDDRRPTGPSVQEKRLALFQKTQGAARESALVGRIGRRLAQVPGCYVRNIHGSEYHAGIPDLVGCLHGIFFAIEVKQDGQKPSRLQAQEMKKILACRGFAEWFDSYDRFEQWLIDFEAYVLKYRVGH